MNNYCASGGAKSYQLPDGSTVQRAACTQGQDTFIVEPLFNKLSLADQALLMMHERLTTLRDSVGGRNYQAIAGVLSGLKLAIETGRSQKQTKKQLTEAEANRLTEMYTSLAELQDMDSAYSGSHPTAYTFHAIANGGGKIAENIVVAPTAYVDLFSRVDANKDSCPNSGCRIDQNVEILNSKVTFYDKRTFIAAGEKLSDGSVPGFAEYFYLSDESQGLNTNFGKVDFEAAHLYPRVAPWDRDMTFTHFENGHKWNAHPASASESIQGWPVLDLSNCSYSKRLGTGWEGFQSVLKSCDLNIRTYPEFAKNNYEGITPDGKLLSLTLPKKIVANAGDATGVLYDEIVKSRPDLFVSGDSSTLIYPKKQ